METTMTTMTFPEPLPASVLADREVKRRDAAVALGRCTTGCADLDDYVLMGGFERGSVVGLSAEDDGVGLQLGLQTLARSICGDSDGNDDDDDQGAVNGLVVTPKPASAILVGLRDAIHAELRAGGTVEGQVAARTRECLDRVMVSCVFDLDGLWEVLADLHRPASAPASAAPASAVISDEEQQTGSPTEAQEKTVAEVDEIGDSQEDDDELLSSPPKPKTPKKQPPPRQQQQDKTQQRPKLPTIILITHFSSLLTDLFTHREKSAAHSTLQLLGTRLRDLTRRLSSSPLVVFLNSTSTSPSSSAPEGAPHLAKRTAAASDPTLRSIFNPPPPPPPGSHVPPSAGGPSLSSLPWRNKPSFGLVFAQLLDLHLLCTRVPRTAASHPGGGGGGGGGGSASPMVRTVWVVEVLLDDMGVWQGRKGARPDREQRWTALDVQGGRFIEAFPKSDKESSE